MTVVRVMRSELQAEPQPQSWGDRLAHKWNFRIPGLPQLVEIHIGCLGQTGEQDELPAQLLETSVVSDVGPFQFRVPAPEEQVTIATLQRMYRHFYIRFTDVLNLTGLVRAGRLDFTGLRTSAMRWSIWPGVATLLKITSDYNERAGAGPLPLPDFVVEAARFGAEVTYVGEQFLRVPMLPQGSGLFLQQSIGTGTALRFSRRGSLVSVTGTGRRSVRQSAADRRRQGNLVVSSRVETARRSGRERSSFLRQASASKSSTARRARHRGWEEIFAFRQAHCRNYSASAGKRYRVHQQRGFA